MRGHTQSETHDKPRTNYVLIRLHASMRIAGILSPFALLVSKMVRAKFVSA